MGSMNKKQADIMRCGKAINSYTWLKKVTYQLWKVHVAIEKIDSL